MVHRAGWNLSFSDFSFPLSMSKSYCFHITALQNNGSVVLSVCEEKGLSVFCLKRK